MPTLTPRLELQSRRLPRGGTAAMASQATTLTDVDRCRLGTLLTSVDTAAFGGSRARFDLETKIEDAQAIPVASAPRSLVTMNSTVELIDTASGERRTCTLVYPEDKDCIPHSVGVLQPLGRSLLGCLAGDIVSVVESGNLRRFKIDSIVYQPERAGAHHL